MVIHKDHWLYKRIIGYTYGSSVIYRDHRLYIGITGYK